MEDGTRTYLTCSSDTFILVILATASGKDASGTALRIAEASEPERGRVDHLAGPALGTSPGIDK